MTAPAKWRGTARFLIAAAKSRAIFLLPGKYIICPAELFTIALCRKRVSVPRPRPRPPDLENQKIDLKKTRASS